MLGINYESSDEEEIVAAPIAKKPSGIDVPKVAALDLEAAQAPSAPTGPINGPAQGPTAAPAGVESSVIGDSPSPFISTQATIRNLTLPTFPNFQIPASPPGSPPLRPTKKFEQFLELKRKGQHFNQRLENSSVMRDPGHLQRLMDFAGISEEEQHASSLGQGLAVPAAFPEWAYFDSLSASQKKITKTKEDANARTPREAIDFVPAAGSGTSSGTGTPSGKGLRQSAAERVMAGLDRPQPSKRKDLEHRGGRNESTSGRSPKRRRSRSRERR